MKAFCETLTMPDESFRITSFFSAQFEHVVAVHPHWHPEVEILYIISGYATQQINEQYFTAEAGDIVIIGKDQLHSTYSYQNSQCKILVLQFDASDLLAHSVLVENDGAEEIFGNNILFKEPIKTETGTGKVLKDTVFEAHKELCDKRNGYKAMVRSLLYRIAGLLIREKPYSLEKGKSKDMRLVREVLENTFQLIDKSYSEEISLRDAASASNLSTPHFCRLFKKATGMTFNTYLSFYRVNRAEKMLRYNKTLTSVAMECGFGSVSAFIRNFKKHKNCTPSAYKDLA